MFGENYAEPINEWSCKSDWKNHGRLGIVTEKSHPVSSTLVRSNIFRNFLFTNPPYATTDALSGWMPPAVFKLSCCRHHK